MDDESEEIENCKFNCPHCKKAITLGLKIKRKINVHIISIEKSKR